MSGVVHSLDMVAVRIGLALAHAIDASPGDGLALYWDAFLASLDEPVRKELEMQLQQHHWEPRSDWGKDFFNRGRTARDTALPDLLATIDAAFPDGNASCFGLSVSHGEPPVPG